MKDTVKVNQIVIRCVGQDGLEVSLRALDRSECMLFSGVVRTGDQLSLCFNDDDSTMSIRRAIAEFKRLMEALKEG